MTAAAVAVSGVSFTYRDEPILRDVSFRIGRGEFVALTGSNGSGKSTLIRVLLGLLPRHGGTAELLGTAPERLRDRWRVGYVPQRPTTTELLPATVADVVAAGLVARRGWWRPPRRADADAVGAALEVVALTEQRHRRLDELSGGQQQRAFIAKALVARPELLVLDEPTAGVDAQSQERFRDALVATRDAGGTVLLVSHELSAVERDLDRILLVRGGRIAFDGTPDALVAEGVSLGVHAHDLPVWLEDEDR